MFIVIPPLLKAAHTADLSHPAAQDTVKPQPAPPLIPPEKQWTTDLEVNQSALLEADKTETRVRNCEPGAVEAVETIEDALVQAAGAVAIMEEASHVALVSENRSSFVHRSKVLYEHLVLVLLHPNTHRYVSTVH